METKPQMTKKKILVVDDHPIVRRGFALLINQEPDMEVCGEAETPEEALQIIEQSHPDLAIVDITLKGGTNGLELLKELTQRYPKLPALVVSMHDEQVYAERVLRSGAKGYIMKQEVDSAMVGAVRSVLNGGIYLSQEMNRQLLTGESSRRSPSSETMIDKLSDREFEVFRLLGQGLGTRRIAETLDVSIKTVETFRSRIKEKLNLEDGNQLVQVAVGWAVRNNQL